MLLLSLLACRTQPLADHAPFPDLSSAPQFVSCGDGQPACSIAAGEHCCEDATLHCETTTCSFRRYDCDGPEDCPGGVCCFGESSRCATDCPGGAEMCHSIADCPKGQVCCTNFVLGSGDGLCLGACD
jgi:hypothetical protein